MNSLKNDNNSKQDSNDEIILSSDDDEDDLFETKMRSNSPMMKKIDSLEASLTQSNEKSKISFLMLNDSSIIKTPKSDSNFIFPDSDSDNQWDKSNQIEQEIELCLSDSDDDDQLIQNNSSEDSNSISKNLLQTSMKNILPVRKKSSQDSKTSVSFTTESKTNTTNETLNFDESTQIDNTILKIPFSSTQYPLKFTDIKLNAPCFVRLKPLDQNATHFYLFEKYKARPSKKKKYTITYKNVNLSESESSNESWDSRTSKKKKKSKPKITISSSDLSLRDQNMMNYPSPNISIVSHDSVKKTSTKRKVDDFDCENREKKTKSLSTNLPDLINEDTNLDFDNSNFQVSRVDSVKLKFKKCKNDLESGDDDSITGDSVFSSARETSNSDENSNHTILLSSSRSNSPAPSSYSIDSNIRKPKKRLANDFDSEESNEAQTEEKTNKVPVIKQAKKSNNLLKTTLKKQAMDKDKEKENTMTNQKSSISVDKINKVKKDGVLDKNEIKSSDSNKVAKKIVKKAISQIVAKEKSPIKNSSKNDDNVKSVNNEQPKPFKIPKLKKPDETLENLIIKPDLLNTKQKTTQNESVEPKTIQKDVVITKKKPNNNTQNNNNSQNQGIKPKTPEINQSVTSKLVNSNIKKYENKLQKVLEMTRNKPIPTLNDLNQKRLLFNRSIGANHPYFSLLYLIDDYCKKMSKVASLNFSVLMDYLPPDEEKEDNELSINCLDKNKQLQLCKLISRSTGKINFYRLFNMDCLLREYPRKYDENVTNLNNLRIDDDYFLSILNNFSLSQSYIIYKRLMLQLTNPFRTVEATRIGSYNYETLKIKFENDFMVESYDISIESVVFSSLHKEPKKFAFVNNFLHQNFIFENETEENSILYKNDKLVIKPDSYDQLRKKVNDDQLLDKMFTKSVFEKALKTKMPEDLITSCQTQRNIKTEIVNYDKIERFRNHATKIRSERGQMRMANKHKFITDREFNLRLQKLQTDHGIQVDMSYLFKESN